MKRLASIAMTILMGCASSKSIQLTLPVQHTVQHGETIADIAQRYYGDENRSEGINAIFKANPEIKRIERGPGIPSNPLVLTIPKLEEK